MVKLYDLNKALLRGINHYKDYHIESTLSDGDKVLYLSIPAEECVDILPEMYLANPEQEYVIKEINDSARDGYRDVVARLNLEDLDGKAFARFESTEQTVEQCLALALAGTGWTIGACDIKKKRTIRKTDASAKEIIEQVCKTYTAEVSYDTRIRKVDILEKIGAERGCYFSDQLNLRNLSRQISSYDFYTVIVPTGKDGLTIESVNDGVDYLENHQYSRKNLVYRWKDERYTVPENLMEDARIKLEELSKPRKAFLANIIDLASISPEQYDILDYGLGDTITLISRDLQIREKQRIVSLDEYPDEPHRNTAELSNTVLSFEEYAQKAQEAAETVDNITNDNGQIDGDTIDGIHSWQVVDLENSVIEMATIKELQTNVLDVSDKITVVNAEVGALTANLANFEEVTTGKIDAIEGNFDSLNTDYLEFKDATGDSLDVIGATVGDLEAESARVKQLLAGNITADNIHAGAITAGSGIIADGAIGDAQISDLSANKITSGRVDTGKVIVGSQDGHLQIQDNTIQISDGTRIRVQIGRDGVGDYSMTVVDDAGKIMWDSNGMTGDAIKSGIIRDSMVSDDANISGRKLDINSVVTSINGATEKIDQTVIQVGNKSLSVYLAEQSQTITDQEKTLTEQSSKITAMDDEIKLRVDSQTYTQDKEKMESSLTKATSDISILQGQIALKVEQTDIDKSVSTAINTAKAEISVETGKISQSVSEIRTEIQDLKAETNSGLDEIRDTVQTNYTNATQHADKIVMDALTEYVKTGDLESFKETISTQFQQTAEDFTFNFSRLTERITTVEGETQSQYTELKKYIRFVDGDIVLGQENNPLILTIRNDRIAFTQAGIEVAYFSNSKMYVTDLEATNSLTIGRLKFTPRDNGSIDINMV